MKQCEAITCGKRCEESCYGRCADGMVNYKVVEKDGSRDVCWAHYQAAQDGTKLKYWRKR